MDRQYVNSVAFACVIFLVISIANNNNNANRGSNPPVTYYPSGPEEARAYAEGLLSSLSEWRFFHLFRMKNATFRALAN